MSLHYNDLTSAEKHIIDVASVATMVGSLSHLLPDIAAGLTIAWTAIRLWESPTVQGWFGRKPPDKSE